MSDDDSGLTSLEEAWIEYIDATGRNVPPEAVPGVRRVFYAGAVAAMLLMVEGNGDQLLREVRKFRGELESGYGHA